jgi:hypothetical protein
MTHLAIAAAILLVLIYGGCGANFVRFSRLMLGAIAVFAAVVWWAKHPWAIAEADRGVRLRKSSLPQRYPEAFLPVQLPGKIDANYLK